MNHDIYLRAHTVVQEKGERERKSQIKPPTWPDRVLIFDTETTIDTRQDLTLLAYRKCPLVGGRYVCSEEGLVYADDLELPQRGMLESYVSEKDATVEVKTFPPKLKLKLCSRSEFIEKVFWKAIKEGAMVVGFNLPFDLSRIAVGWSTGRNGRWSLILSLRRSRKTGRIEPNPERPRVRIKSKDSKSAFISLARPQRPEEWPKTSRFLDLHTLAFALFAESLSLEGLCKRLKIPGKIEHEPTGKVTLSEIDYCRGDVRATTDALNALKTEFDQHPLALNPDRAYSPASMAKAYLDAMGVIPPKDKFKVPMRILGIAMQAYYGGRAECRVRCVPVPVIHTDFKSQYPTVNTLLGNWNVLISQRLFFEDATKQVRRILARVTLGDLFNPDFWRRFNFFALVRPGKDILPVRTVYNGETQNIGINEFSSERPIWFAGPDIIASVLLTGKVPRIEKAIRIVPHGRQEGLKPINLRGMVSIDPKTHDFFRHVVEQREIHKSDESLGGFLKVLANSGSYGSFVEITPENQAKPARVRVFSGERSFEQPSNIIEKQGRWYFPPLAALITAGGRLLLAMLERCVTDAGGTYLFCDTDSLCIVASKSVGMVPCPGGTHKLENGSEAVKALSLKEVQRIADRFGALNPYDRTTVPGILKIEKVNFDPSGNFRQLYGYAVSAKRYVLYRQKGSELTIVDPKAHGLGYLYPPIDKKDEKDPDWTFEAWEWLLRQELELQPQTPAWLDIPAMMRIVLSTPNVLDRLKYFTRPYNFLFCPLIDPLAGIPANVDPTNFTPITPFTQHRDLWSNAECTNVRDGKVYRLALEQSPKLDKLIPQTFGYILRLYLRHPESKSLAPDGTSCEAITRGLLKRASIIAGQLRFVGKETDRRWEHGEDLSLLTFKAIEYAPSGKVVADRKLRNEIAKRGMRELMRLSGLSQHTIEAIRGGKPVRRVTLQRLLTQVQATPCKNVSPDVAMIPPQNVTQS